MVINCKMKATKRIEMEIAADVQTKKCNGIGGEPQGLCGQKVIHVNISKVTYQKEKFFLHSIFILFIVQSIKNYKN